MSRRFGDLLDEIATVSDDGPLGVERLACDCFVAGSLPERGYEVDVVDIMTVVSASPVE